MELERKGVPDEKREVLRQRLLRKESDYMRLRRMKMTVESFESLKVIGRFVFSHFMSETNDTCNQKGRFRCRQTCYGKGNRDLVCDEIALQG